MRIAVVGSGIAGLASAWLLSREHEVILFEADARLGGHTHTHEVELHGRPYAVDSGFIVFNPHNYPLLTRLFADLGVASQATTMSFAVHDERNGLEYNATNLDALFCQRRNLLSPRFYGMLRDLFRFYREAPALLDAADAGPTLGDYLDAGGYGALFREDHLIPMASALWSSPSAQILAFTQFADRWIWDVPVTDVNATNPGISAVTRTLTVPPGVPVDAWFTNAETNTSNNRNVLWTALDQTDQAPSSTLFSMRVNCASAYVHTAEFYVKTSSAQIRYRTDASGAADGTVVVTKGWIWRRGRDS